MAELHEALTYLSPVDWEDVPKDNLKDYVSKCFNAAELLVNSVPPVPDGTPFHTATPHFTSPNSAKSAKDVFPSPARPSPPDPNHGDLVKHWGKPMKFSKKDNPLEVALYKMAGHDRHGQWYARHQVEEGLGFDKFKKALLREFPETLLTQGAPGAGAKRGLSAERRVERIEVDGVGRVEVYQLSAQMPSPVTPREFLTLFISTDDGLSEKSGAAAHDGKKHVPRNFMIVSRPLDHPDVPQRSSFVRGQYESVELIREIPLHVSPSKSSLALDAASSNGEIDPELNPVEWIMVTRSDPAGGVPRFLVDRGTPGAMLTDVSKFLNWACAYEEVPHQDEDLEKQLQTSDQSGGEAVTESTHPTISQRDGSSGDNVPLQTEDQPPGEAPVASSAPEAQQAGIVSNLTNTLEAGVNTYAPVSVANFVNNRLNPDTTTADLSDSDSSSTDSFMSADEMKRFSTAPEGPEGLPRQSTENLSIASAASSSEISRTEKKNLNHHEKELLKITQQREKLDQKLAKQRMEQENKLKQSQAKEESEQSKARERQEKEIQKSEERHRKEIEKLEARREKELKKAEERRKKRADQDKLSLVARERDEARSQADLLNKENELLRDQVESLQRENTALASRVGKLGGPDALKSVQDEIGMRSRSGTTLSAENVSMKSTGS